MFALDSSSFSSSSSSSFSSADEALDIVMETWYRWKYARETMNIEEDVMLVQKPMVSVPFAIQNMLSTTRSFFDHRNTVRWDEAQMLASQQACFDADWLRCVEGPLSFLFPPTTMANTEMETVASVDGSQSLLASEAQILHMETTRSILSEHYGKLEHIFSLYAAADGGPYELGQQGATQLFLDLRMLLTDEEARVEGERQEAEQREKEEEKERAKNSFFGASGGAKFGRGSASGGGLRQGQSSSMDDSTVHAPTVVLNARTTIEDFNEVWNDLLSRCTGLMPDEGIRRHHFLCLLVLLATRRYRKKFTTGVCLRYMLTWEVCRGQIDFNPRKFRADVLYTSDITDLLSEHAHALQSLFVDRATSVGSHESLRSDTGSSYVTFEHFRDLLRSRGLTDFAGVSESHVRLAFAASQDSLVDEPHTHPPGLLLDEMCEAIVRVAYSMLLTAEERVATNKVRLKRVARNRRRVGQTVSAEERRELVSVAPVKISMERVTQATISTINILMGIVKASDDPNIAKTK